MGEMRGYIERPLTSEEMLKMAKFLDGVTYHIKIGNPPNFSIIRFYDQITQRDWGLIQIPLYFQKDLDEVARHFIRFFRAFGTEIYRHECLEKHKHSQKELDDM